MKIAITSDSTIDLTADIKRQWDIRTVPFTVLLGDEVYIDGEITPEEIFDYVNKTKVLPTTSAVNAYQYEEFFNDTLKEYDAIVHLAFNSKMSCAYQNAKSVAENMENVYIIDTQNLSTAIALLAIKARKLANSGLTPTQIVDEITALLPYSRCSLILSKLDYLHKGGRCSALQLLGANLLKLKPFFNVENGKLILKKKYIGKWSEGVKKYLDDLMTMYDEYDKEEAFVSYTTAPRDLVDYLVAKLKSLGFKNVYTSQAGCTIACHCGENTIGIHFIAK